MRFSWYDGEKVNETGTWIYFQSEVMKMIILNRWREFGINTAPPMSASFENKPYDGAEKIAKYLEKGKVATASCGVSTDFYTGERIMGKKESLTDGEYIWSCTLPYYVRRYNLRLPAEFERKVLNRTK